MTPKQKRLPENREVIGKGKPPKRTQFKPGQSGNPGGRPKKKPITEIYEKIFANSKNVKEIEASVLKVILGGRMGAVLQLKEMAERIEGKVTQPVEVNGELTMTISERMQKARERRAGK